MNIRNNSIITLLNVIFMVALIIAPTDAFAACDYEPDAPDCACFDDTGAWDPAGAFIQDVATATVGTQEDCVDDGGKPYYQMVLGCNSEDAAILMSFLLAWQGWDWGFDERQAWCSETISYWHREDGIPYAGGYSTGWHTDWQVHGVGTLKEWYTTEEGSGGRGRWIEPEDVDYEDFELGVTVPVPGAYVGIREYDAVSDTWVEDGGTHSLMVNEMWVHEDVLGNVFRVEVSLLEGNSSNKVKNTSHWDDVLSLTPQGSDWISTDKKIYGFGIDLNSRGHLIYDASRLHRVFYPVIHGGPQTWAVYTKDPIWQWYQQRASKLTAYAKLMRATGEPNVVCSDPTLKIDKLPDGQTTQWYFPKGLPGGVEVVIDLLDVHPLPVKGIELRWDSRFLPWNYKVQFAGADQRYSEAILPKPPTDEIPTGSRSIPVPVMFSSSRTGVAVRYVKLIFYSTFARDAILQNLRFRYEQGPLKDTEDMCQYKLTGDLNNDCRVDFYDLARMAANWLIDCNIKPNPACVPK